MKFVGILFSFLFYTFMVNEFGFANGFFLWIGALVCIGIVVSIVRKLADD